MMRQVTAVNWKYIGDAVPAFVTLAFMPLSYSVAYGLIAGLLTYATLNGLIYVTKIISFGRIVPPDADLAEYWTYKPHGGHLPWFIRLTQRNIRLWNNEHEEIQSRNREQDADEESVKEVMPYLKGDSVPMKSKDMVVNTDIGRGF